MVRGDIEIIFESVQTQRYLTSKRSERMKYRIWAQEDKFRISKRPYIILLII